MKSVASGTNIRNLSQGILGQLCVPLAPVETQPAIAIEFETVQALVNAGCHLIARMELKIQSALVGVWCEEPDPHAAGPAATVPQIPAVSAARPADAHEWAAP